mmetsp:Transcript_15717/g.24137  ORF Transcript_15717/g.24137 Transcript_15717/m.24137 type:complete len:311 (+) Transcript_15717:247-1179(+)
MPDENDITNNPWIMSTQVALGKNSFCDKRQSYVKLAPPPKYFSEEFLIKNFSSLPTDVPTILHGLESPAHGGLICTDQEALNKQKGVLGHVMKQLAINLMKGLTISHISLPIKIFEPKSSIQRIVDMWAQAPVYLRQAADIQDPLERFKNVIASMISSIYLCCGQNKPFNPLLGETLQGNYPDGTKFYCEHTSHHPPISNFLVEDVQDKFTLSGYYEVCGKMGTNSLTSGLRGPNNLIFADGHHIRFGYPSYKLGGMVMGDRTIEAHGCCIFEDLTYNRKCVIIMNTFKKTGWIRSSSSGSKDAIIGSIY